MASATLATEWSVIACAERSPEAGVGDAGNCRPSRNPRWVDRY
jgi:hypothetical protein